MSQADVTPTPHAPPRAEVSALRQQRDALAHLLRRQADVMRALEVSDVEESLRRIEERVRADDFKVLVLGEPSRGKSMLLNALLRREILLASAVPSAVVNIVKWGETPQAVFRPAGSTNADAEEIPVEDIPQRSTGADNGTAGGGFSQVELRWPLELCRPRVEFIEIPSLNHADGREFVREHLAQSDAALFVLACDALGSRTEMEFIDEELAASGIADAFFICNRLDSVRLPQREGLKEHALSQLAPRTSGGSARVFFTSVLDALEGHLEADEARFEASGIKPLEEALGDYLSQGRERAKIQRAALVLRAALRRARRLIEENENSPWAAPKGASEPAPRAGQDSTAEAQRQDSTAEAQEFLRRLEEKRVLIADTASNSIARSRDLIRDVTLNHLHELSDKIRHWVDADGVSLTAKVAALFSAVETRKTVARMSEDISAKVEREVTRWRADVLARLAAERVELLWQELSGEVGLFARQLKETRDDSRANEAKVQESDATFEGLDAANLVASFVQTPNGEVMGDRPRNALPSYSYRGLIPVVLAAVVLAGLGWRLTGWSPLSLLLLGLAGGAVAAYYSADAAHRRNRRLVARQCVAALRSSANDYAERTSEHFSEILDRWRAGFDADLTQKIREAQQRLETAQETVRQAATGNETRRWPTHVYSELAAINRELDNLIKQAGRQ